IAHRGINGVPGLGQGIGGQAAEAGRSTGDENDLAGHDCLLWVWVQMIPPLARSTWPLIQAPSGPARKATALAMSWGWPRRSSGASLVRLSITACGLPSRNSAVAVGPGAMALTVMLRPRSSLARIWVMASTPALVAA